MSQTLPLRNINFEKSSHQCFNQCMRFSSLDDQNQECAAVSVEDFGSVFFAQYSSTQRANGFPANLG